jgi:hypothetical protein
MLRRRSRCIICLGFAVFAAATASAQSVSERNGRIFFTDQNGAEKPITYGNLDSQPHLSLDKRQIVFVRQTPGQTAETGSGDVDKTELWIASVDGSKEPKRVLTGGGFIEGPTLNIVIAGFDNPQFSPDATRIYFKAYAWATAFEIMMLDVPTGNTKPLFPGLGFEVIGTGKYRGFLIGTTDPLTEARGRIRVYRLLDPNGKAVKRIGENESDLIQFKRKYDIH